MDHKKLQRVTSIDLLRGLVMALMLLDHCRDFFHFSNITLDINPLDPKLSSTPIYLTRWITHLCAPIFIALAGISIYIQKHNQRRSGNLNLTTFLLTRGAWLIFLEVSLVNFAWTFNPTFQSRFIQVIGAIGICMVFMAALVHLPKKTAFGLGVFIVLFHNLTDPIHLETNTLGGLLWALMHEGGPIHFSSGFKMYVAYPFIPWLGIMLVGFGAGSLFLENTTPIKRTKILLISGISLILGFFFLRFLNSFGDPEPWSAELWTRSFWFEFFNVEKYPPSLLYAMATLGIGCILLVLMENGKLPFANALRVFGRVPFFYYLLHLYLIHIEAIVLFILLGGSWGELQFGTYFGGLPPGFGIGIAGVYAVWLLTLTLLYPVCRWYDGFKTNNKSLWWTSYL